MFTGSIQKTEPNKRKGGVQHFLSFLLLPVFALTIFAGKASAQIDGYLDAEIPFSFHVGTRELPAGKYRIHVLDEASLRVMEITSADGSTSAIFQVEESDAKSAPAQSELIFNKYGDNYFLSKFYDEGNPSGSELIESRYEKQLSKGAVVAQEHLPAHHKMQQGD
jgi:hypothetical protein